MSGRFLSLCAALFLAFFHMPAKAADCSSLPAEATGQVDRFFAKMKAAQAEAALDDILQSSPLWNNRVGVKEQLLGGVDTYLSHRTVAARVTMAR